MKWSGVEWDGVGRGCMLHINGSAYVSGCGRTSSSSVSGLVRSIHSVDADVSWFRCHQLRFTITRYVHNSRRHFHYSMAYVFTHLSLSISLCLCLSVSLAICIYMYIGLYCMWDIYIGKISCISKK